MSIATATLSPAEKLLKQTKLLGATVKGLGLVTTVSSTLPWCYALIEDTAGHEHHRFLADLNRDEVHSIVFHAPVAVALKEVA